MEVSSLVTRGGQVKKNPIRKEGGENTMLIITRDYNLVVTCTFVQTQRLRLKRTHKDRATHNSDIPDFSSTVVPLPATCETAFISPRNNNTTLHMFPRYSSRKYSSRKKLRPTSREYVHFSLRNFEHDRIYRRFSRRGVPESLSHRFQSLADSRHSHQLGRLHPLLLQIGDIRSDDLYVPRTARFFGTICKCGAM